MAILHPIDNLNLPDLQVYINFHESQLAHFYEPKPGVFIAESPKVIERALAAGYEPLSFLVEEGAASHEAADLLNHSPDVTAYVASGELMRSITGYPMTRGMLSCMRRKALSAAAEVTASAGRIAVLENVVNPTNLGAIFRSAAALSMDAVLLSPGCTDPLYRRAIRVSMGTVFQIPWTFIGESAEDWEANGISYLHDLGFKTASMALRADTCAIDAPVLTKEPRLAVLLGNEGNGLADTTIETSDYTVCIPMSHGVDSLNVAAASAVAFWQLGKREQ